MKKNDEKYILLSEDAGQRIDEIVAKKWARNKSHAKKLIDENKIQRNGKDIKKAGEKGKMGDILKILPSEKKEADEKKILPAAKILFENEYFLVAEKPWGLPSHADLHHDDALNRRVAQHHTLSEIGAPMRNGVVHRLDKDTSGLILLAKNDATHLELQKIFADRKIEKHYFTLIHGHNLPARGTIDAPIFRDPKNRLKMAISTAKSARPARTHFEILEQFSQTAFLDVHLETGRTHQIRVHLASIGHPVVGDPLYGAHHLDEEKKSRRLFLHAHSLRFSFRGKKYFFESPLPHDLRNEKKRITQIQN